VTHPIFQSLTHAVEIHYEELRHFLRRKTGSALMAEEIVQEVWIRAKSTSVDMPDNPRAYLYRMAENMAIDHVRKESTRNRMTNFSDLNDNDSETNVESIPSALPEPIESIINQQEFAVLNAAVRELPDKCREVFLLYRGQGLRMKEIAEMLGVSEKTVEKHIARAMLHCRERLRQAGRNL